MGRAETEAKIHIVLCDGRALHGAAPRSGSGLSSSNSMATVQTWQHLDASARV